MLALRRRASNPVCRRFEIFTESASVAPKAHQRTRLADNIPFGALPVADCSGLMSTNLGGRWGGVAISLLIASPMLRDHVNGMRGFSALRCWLGRRFRDRLGPNVSAALAMVGPALRAGPHHARVQRPKCIVPLTAAAASGRPAWWVARPSKGFDNGKLSADLIFAWRPADAPHATRPRPAC